MKLPITIFDLETNGLKNCSVLSAAAIRCKADMETKSILLVGDVFYLFYLKWREIDMTDLKHITKETMKKGAIILYDFVKGNHRELCERLEKELGSIDYCRFLQIVDPGKGDYTKERRKQLEKEGNRFSKDERSIIFDTKTNLEWLVGPDKDTTLDESKAWVKSLGGGWRLPTGEELQGLYEAGEGTRNIDPVFEMTGWWVWVWSSVEKGSSRARHFSFYNGDEYSDDRDYSNDGRGFSVRSRR